MKQYIESTPLAELEEERDRLTTLAYKGQITPKQATQLSKIKAAIRQIKNVLSD